MNSAIYAACLAVWIYVLSVLKRAKLSFFLFLVGSVGAFLFMMILLSPILTVPLVNAISAASGMLGDITHFYRAYPGYGILFISAKDASVSLNVDFECSGVIEILAFLSLLWFFPVYNLLEKAVISIAGTVYIFVANIMRLFVTCLIIYKFGGGSFYLAHSIIGRLLFYGLSIMLYFWVFTKSQITRQKIGGVKYESGPDNSVE